MFDQAEALRMLVRDRGLGVDRNSVIPRIYTIAVTSGKGGVGKTSIAVNLALLLSRSGKRVRLVDADFGLSNAEVLLGVSPKYTMSDVLKGTVDVRDAWTQVGDISLLSSGSGMEDMANMDLTTGGVLINHILSSVSDGDVVIMDTAPGINYSVRSLLGFADEVMVVTTPEPTSITDAYAAIKVLVGHTPNADITLVANSCSNPSQATSVAEGLDTICNKFLKISFQRYEYLPADPAVGWAVRHQNPVAISSSHSMVATWLRKAAIKLDDRIRKHHETNVVRNLLHSPMCSDVDNFQTVARVA